MFKRSTTTAKGFDWAGFPRDVAERALDLSPEEATERLLAARRD